MIDGARLASFLDAGTALFAILIPLATRIAYKLFLRGVTPERHRIFNDHFRNLNLHGIAATCTFALYHVLVWAQDSLPLLDVLTRYTGLIALCWIAIIIVKSLRIVAYEYLFLTSMKAGVPLLLVNILTLIFYIIAGAWLLSTVFHVDLKPLLATSAVLSIVLGLALQDTIGNLFAGISLQFDKPFGLGDWIEVRNGSERFVGKVDELSWRATILRATTDELITLPNRLMAQCQIANFSGSIPFLRNQIFRLPHEVSIETAKKAILDSLHGIPGVILDPAPVVLITETTESWVVFKLFYSITDYGSQFSIGDRVISAALQGLRNSGIPLATDRLALEPKTQLAN